MHTALQIKLLKSKIFVSCFKAKPESAEIIGLQCGKYSIKIIVKIHMKAMILNRCLLCLKSI